MGLSMFSETKTPSKFRVSEPVAGSVADVMIDHET
jgi:hypothetical protein